MRRNTVADWDNTSFKITWQKMGIEYMLWNKDECLTINLASLPLLARKMEYFSTFLPTIMTTITLCIAPLDWNHEARKIYSKSPTTKRKIKNSARSSSFVREIKHTKTQQLKAVSKLNTSVLKKTLESNLIIKKISTKWPMTPVNSYR